MPEYQWYLERQLGTDQIEYKKHTWFSCSRCIRELRNSIILSQWMFVSGWAAPPGDFVDLPDCPLDDLGAYTQNPLKLPTKPPHSVPTSRQHIHSTKYNPKEIMKTWMQRLRSGKISFFRLSLRWPNIFSKEAVSCCLNIIAGYLASTWLSVSSSPNSFVGDLIVCTYSQFTL